MDDKKRERDRRYREKKKKLAEAALAPKEPFTVSGMPEEAVKTEKDMATPDLLEPHFDTATAGEDKMAIATVKPHPAEAAAAPSQLDRIEALLLELVETNRKMHPNISEALGGF